MKRKVPVMLALVLVLTMLVGNISIGDGNFNETGMPIVNETITLKVMQYIRDTDAITMEGLWYPEHIEESTNIHIEYTQVNQSDWETQVNLMFASGDYADVIVNGGTIQTEMYGVDQGILIPVNDLVDQYMPVYKERLEASPLAAAGLVKSDGKMYSIGRIADYGSNCNGEFFINQTWLDELGLAAPTNTNELYEVLKAFVASGNGRIGYEGTFDEMTTYFLHLWGIPESTYRFSVTDDKQAVLNCFRPGYREAIEYLNKLYTEGLMDPASITQDSNSKISKYNENNVGLTTMHRLKSMGWDILEQDMVHLMPPAAEGYSPKFYSLFSVASECVMISCTNPYPEATARWIDYQMEDQPTFESFYGPEGVLWNWNDEHKCELGPAGDQGVMEYALGVCGIYYLPAYYYNTVFQQPDYRQERIDYCNAYSDLGYIEKYPVAYARNLAPMDAEDAATIERTYANVKALYDQAIADMIMNGVTDEKWESFLNNMQNAGAEDYIGVYQKALDAYFAANPDA